KTPLRMPLRIRVPYWATRGGTVKLNGRELESFAEPTSYYVLNRTWQDGDKVEITMPMSLHIHPMPDNDTIQAAMYGPLVLTGRLGLEGLTKERMRAEPTAIRQVPEYKSTPVPAPEIKTASHTPLGWIEPIPGRSLEFRTVGQAQNITLVPFYKLLDERYVVYWRVSRA
ncbi:MAG TPA: DUF4986 domain-containing protein, partial [Blastocatellia bacterium]|nr:DUF4986 domain-containing protein [Blastocatellia bacterium]